MRFFNTLLVAVLFAAIDVWGQDLSVAVSGDTTIFFGESTPSTQSTAVVDPRWMPSGLDTMDVTCVAMNAVGHVFAGTYGDGVFRSTDNGGTWTAVNNGLAHTYIVALATTPAGILTAVNNKERSTAVIYFSPDNGETWKGVYGPTLPFIYIATWKDTVFAAINGAFTGGGVIRSIDGGQKWEAPTLTGFSLVSITVSPKGVFAGNGNGQSAWRSLDRGQTWALLVGDLSTVRVYSLTTDANGDVFAGSLDSKGVFKTLDNGDHWLQVHPFASIVARGGQNMFVADLTGGIFRSQDYGQSWETFGQGLPGASRIHAFAFSPNLNWGFAGVHDRGIFRRGFPFFQWFRDAVHIEVPARQFRTAIGFAIINKGVAPDTITVVQAGATNQAEFRLRQDVEVKQLMVGEEWDLVVNIDLASSTVPGNETLWVDTSTEGLHLPSPLRQMFVLEKRPSTDVAKPGGSMPTAYALAQNYPNPFNPVTTIQFALPEPGRVSLVVYNTLGQKMRTLVDKAIAAGTHTVPWDGRNDAGALLPSGLYFYQIETGNFAAMKRMLLMK